MTDVFDVIGADHREQERLLADLEIVPSRADGATEAQLTARKQLAETLIIEASGHEAVEEQYFWPTVRDRVPDGDQLADHAIAQENEAKHVLDRLSRAQPAEGEFDELIATFIPAAREHIAYEERTVWPALRTAITPDEASELGKKIADAKKLAPTRPHPHTPANPAVLKTAGPAVAAADKLRDSMSGRSDLT